MTESEIHSRFDDLFPAWREALAPLIRGIPKKPGDGLELEYPAFRDFALRAAAELAQAGFPTRPRDAWPHYRDLFERTMPPYPAREGEDHFRWSALDDLCTLLQILEQVIEHAASGDRADAVARLEYLAHLMDRQHSSLQAGAFTEMMQKTIAEIAHSA